MFYFRVMIMLAFAAAFTRQASAAAPDIVNITVPIHTDSTSGFTIDIPVGNCLEIKEVFGTSYLSAKLTVGGATYDTPASPPRDSTGPSKFYGPASLVLFGSLDEPIHVQYTLSLTAPDSVASNPVVIPDDGSGNYAVVMEASEDLKNWTTLLPGPISAATHRFFRTRIQKN